MSDTMQDEFYTASEAAHVLGITEAELAERSEHILNLRKTAYYRWYVDELAAFLQIGTSRGYKTRDDVVIELWWLKWLYDEESVSNKQKIRVRLKTLVESSTVVTLEVLHTMLNGAASTSVIARWAQKKRIITVRIGVTYYLSASYAAWLQEIYTWPTLADLTRQTHCSPTTIFHRAKRGWYITCTAPNRVLRVSPKSPLAPDEAAKVIGTTPSVIRRAIKDGTIQYRKIGAKFYFIEYPIAMQLRMRFRTLNNTSFAWLQDHLDHEAETLSVKQVARRLCVSNPTVARWLEKGLLPYYDRSMGSGAQATICIPLSYIDGLLRFTNRGALRVNFKILQVYKAIYEQQSRTV